MSGLEELFNEPGEIEEEVVEEPEVTEPEQPEPEKPAETPSEVEEQKVPLAALQEERRKRQEYERQLREMAEKKPEEPRKPFWENEDPDAVIDQRVNAVAADLEKKFTVRFLKQSEAAARKRFEDYDDTILSFQEVMGTHPDLYRQMIESDDPAEFAYNTGKAYQFTKDAPTIDDLKKKVRAEYEKELREQLEKEYAEKYGTGKLANVPQSLTEETGATMKAKIDPSVSPLQQIFNE